MKRVILSTLAGGLLIAQGANQQHSVTLSWTDANVPTTGDAYNIYRAPGSCPVNPPTVTGAAPFVKIDSTNITALSYLDVNVVGGNNYCYYATTVNGTTESAPSITVQAAVPNVFPPNTLTAVSQ